MKTEVVKLRLNKKRVLHGMDVSRKQAIMNPMYIAHKACLVVGHTKNTQMVPLVDMSNTTITPRAS